MVKNAVGCLKTQRGRYRFFGPTALTGKRKRGNVLMQRKEVYKNVTTERQNE